MIRTHARHVHVHIHKLHTHTHIFMKTALYYIKRALSSKKPNRWLQYVWNRISSSLHLSENPRFPYFSWLSSVFEAQLAESIKINRECATYDRKRRHVWILLVLSTRLIKRKVKTYICTHHGTLSHPHYESSLAWMFRVPSLQQPGYVYIQCMCMWYMYIHPCRRMLLDIHTLSLSQTHTLSILRTFFF